MKNQFLPKTTIEIKEIESTTQQIEKEIIEIRRNNLKTSSTELNKITNYKLILHRFHFALLNTKRQNEMKLLYLLNYNIPSPNTISWSEEQIYQIRDSKITYYSAQPDIKNTVHILNWIEKIIEQIQQNIIQIETIESNYFIKPNIKQKIKHIFKQKAL